MESNWIRADPSSSRGTSERAHRERDPAHDERESADRSDEQLRPRASEGMSVERTAEEDAAQQEGPARRGARRASVPAPTVLEESEEDETERVDHLVEDARLPDVEVARRNVPSDHVSAGGSEEHGDRCRERADGDPIRLQRPL